MPEGAEPLFLGDRERKQSRMKLPYANQIRTRRGETKGSVGKHPLQIELQRPGGGKSEGRKRDGTRMNGSTNERKSHWLFAGKCILLEQSKLSAQRVHSLFHLKSARL